MAGLMDKIERIEATLAVKCEGKLTAYRRFDLGLFVFGSAMQFYEK